MILFCHFDLQECTKRGRPCDILISIADFNADTEGYYRNTRSSFKVGCATIYHGRTSY